MAQRGWTVQKFGGSSLADSSRVEIAAKLSLTFTPENNRNAIVVSAFGGVTNSLVETISLAVRRDERYKETLDAIIHRHLKACIDLFQKSTEKIVQLLDRLNKDKEDLLALLRAVYLSKHCEDTVASIIKGMGEIWSYTIFTQYLHTLNDKLVVLPLDSREIIIASDEVSGPKILWERSRLLMQEWLVTTGYPANVDILVVPGFVATTPEGLPTTLKRNSSDFSAAIFASLLAAKACTIWTDVDGVYSGNPRVIKNPVLLNSLSYNEAIELSYFGAKVLHPSCIQPCMSPVQIPMYIRNTFNIRCPGTKIFDEPNANKAVKGFSTVDGIALLNVEGTGLTGLPDIPHRLFGCLKDINCNTILVTKGSSEHSICFGIDETQAEKALHALNKTFYLELQTCDMDPISIVRQCTVLAVVGDGIIGTPGIAGNLFTAIGRANANIIAISQGSSERNISVVVSTEDANKISGVVHDVIYPPEIHYPASYFALIGPGMIGSTLLKMIDRFNKSNKHREDNIEAIAIATSKKMILSNGEGDRWSGSLNLEEWKTEIEKSTQPIDVDQIRKLLLTCRRETGRPVAIVDTTASDILTNILPQLLASGINVVTANKKPITGRMEVYSEVQAFLKQNRRVQCLYEACVGAGLPVISTLNDMVTVGDHVHKLEGIFSGTLSFIFNEWGRNNDTLFSEIVFKAKALGYTEPDPREDLSGQDFARKLVVLCRKMGLSISLSDINIQSLVPKELENVPVEQFIKELPNFDKQMNEIREKALSAGRVLSYVGSIESPPGQTPIVKLGLTDLEKSHPFAGLSGSDNIISFTTDFYPKNPLVVRGAGAGALVTASGLFSDLQKLKF